MHHVLPSPRRFFILAIASLAACTSNPVSGVTGRQAHELVEKGALLLDVRTPEEFSDGHLPGAVNVPVDVLRSRLNDIGPKDRPVVVHCLSGQRSAMAAGMLHEAGFTRVYDMGPMEHWNGGS